MDWLIQILTLIYVACALALAVYAAGAFALLVVWGRTRAAQPIPPDVAPDDWPLVLIQLPVYNERLVIGRLIEAMAHLDYPADRLRVQVLDDSTDDTTEVVARQVARWQHGDLQIAHLRRLQRDGYKAGALAAGLACQPDAELVAVFDADFVPAPDFLRRVVPHFLSDSHLGMVQTRWGHINADENALTRAQSLSLDGHFVVEQTARSRGGLLLNFSGSGGVWRTDCITDAGGWSFATLAEDLDLSYRAQLRGWRCLYLPDVVVPAEIPPQMMAYRQQQARWAKGSTQNLLLHSRALWRSRTHTLAQKLMATLHLCQYVVHPLMLLLLLLTPPLLALGALQDLSLASLGLVGFGPPLIYFFSQRALYPDYRRRLLAFPVLMALGTGLILSNSLAVFGALRGEPNVFRRTPKFDRQSWQRSSYALQHSGVVLGEAALAFYAGMGVLLALRYAPSLTLFMAIYALAFALVTLWTLFETARVRQVRFRRTEVDVREQISA